MKGNDEKLMYLSIQGKREGNDCKTSCLNQNWWLPSLCSEPINENRLETKANKTRSESRKKRKGHRMLSYAEKRERGLMSKTLGSIQKQF